MGIDSVVIAAGPEIFSKGEVRAILRDMCKIFELLEKHNRTRRTRQERRLLKMRLQPSYLPRIEEALARLIMTDVQDPLSEEYPSAVELYNKYIRIKKVIEANYPSYMPAPYSKNR